MNAKNILVSALTSSVVFGLFLSGLYFINHETRKEQNSNSINSQEVSLVDIPRTSNPINLETAAQRSIHSVVHIKTESTQEGAISYNPWGELFFGSPYQKAPDRKLSGSGSGVIISADGYIATNHHVIKGADQIEVSLNDKRTTRAILIGSDPNTDLALLKIEETDLTPAQYGNSDELNIGEWVLAVGNPFNLTSTVTAGIVSAKGRNINLLKEQYAVESFIQTDAAVNPGNSGGALVNAEGELIGINTAIASNTGSYTGYSFAVPVNLVKKVMSDLRNYGKVQRALLGVKIQDLNSEVIGNENIKNNEGAYISEVYENTAAAAGNLKAGDIVVSVNNQKINSASHLQEQISQYGPGDIINISYRRNGEIKTTKVTLKNTNGTTALVKKENVYLGASYKSLSEEEKSKHKLNNGIKIESLGRGKLKNEGIKEDFIITHLDKIPIESPEQFINLLQNKKGGILVEGIYPNGTRAYYGFGL